VAVRYFEATSEADRKAVETTISRMPSTSAPQVSR
jgi:hypothetical protein